MKMNERNRHKHISTTDATHYIYSSMSSCQHKDESSKSRQPKIFSHLYRMAIVGNPNSVLSTEAFCVAGR